MCGICGFAGFKDNELLFSMTEALKNRGPDAEGYYVSEQESRTSVSLGIRRLKIIDLETGDQPVYNEDKTVVIVFNGEIYNFLELRNNLIKSGHKFYTKTDTEVIVHLYEEYGENCLEYLRGMFAFALWDKRQQKLFIARDRLGIKPLFYSFFNNKLLFASEIKSILKYTEIKKEINYYALDDFFTYLYIPAPKTIYSSINKLLPGHFIVYQNRNLKINRYWDLKIEKNKNFDESYYSTKLFELLSESVKLHTVSDVPLGVFLSGGMDSSSIVALLNKTGYSGIKTFSIGFDVSEYNEIKYAKIVSKKFNTSGQEFNISPEYFDIIHKIFEYLDEPFADSSVIPTYIISEIAKKQLKVILGGDGGDELFAGYIWIMRQKYIDLYNKLPYFVRMLLESGLKKDTIIQNKIQRFLSYASLTPVDSFCSRISCFKKSLKDKIYSDEFKKNIKDYNCYDTVYQYFNNFEGLDFRDKMLYTDLKMYLPDDILFKIDSMSMVHGLELRPPFLDHKLVEFVFSIPYEMKFKRGKSKIILKKVMKDLLPSEILKQRKLGFAIPLNEWLRTGLKNWAGDILFNKVSEKSNLFNNDMIKWMWENHQNRTYDFGQHLWTLIVTFGVRSPNRG